MVPHLTDGVYSLGWSIGDKILPMVAGEDIGLAAASIFNDK